MLMMVFRPRTVTEAIKTLVDARVILQSFNVRLHKIMSNSRKVLEAFPESEWASEWDLLKMDSVIQNALGVTWDCTSDEFVIRASVEDKPFTKRGILSLTNSLYDPIGFISPVILEGRLFQREVLSVRGPGDDLAAYGWDDLLPSCYQKEWNAVG